MPSDPYHAPPMASRIADPAPAPAPEPPGPPGRFAVATGEMSLADAVAAVREAEGLGYEAALAGEAGLEADAFVVSAAALAATSTIRSGPGIANVVDRHPVALARAAASLDRLAPGRALLGLGRGAPAHARALGVEPATTAALEDALRICRALLEGGGVDHAGPRWQARMGAAPSRARAGAPVPLLLAAVGPATLRLAGALADTALLNYASGPEYVAWAVARVREGAERAGRDPERVDVAGYVLVARTDQEDSERQLEAVRRTVSTVHAIPGEGDLLAAPSGGSPSTWTADTLGRFAAVGDAAACRARLDEYRAAGLRCIVLMPGAMRALHRTDGRGEATR
jgi:alkanesulfonate monooxygenase SsuD/methylene tetrahydromethanopterin reductase-like flavin-dependent oxidoreductase (luciferase family)